MHYLHRLFLFIASALCALFVMEFCNKNTIQRNVQLQLSQKQHKAITITDWKGNFVRLMSYKNFCVIGYFLESRMSGSLNYYDRITLVIHMNYEYFDERVISQVAAWNGPISMSIFLSLNNLTNQMDDLRKKYYGNVGNQLCIHLFYQNHNDGLCSHTIPSISLHSTIDETNRYPQKYPINVARNIARMLSRSKYILLSDYEFIYSNGFEAAMRKLATNYLTTNPKAVLVCRTFEALGNMSTVPRDKQSLHNWYKNYTVIEFHTQYVGNAHAIAGLNHWFAHNGTDGEPSIDRSLPYQKNDWEPAFVSLTTIPFHDENFPYLMRDNTVLRWEMCRMNYTFLLVYDHFMVHPGIKKRGDNRMQKSVMKQFEVALKKFRRRMDQLYPETKFICPKL